MNYRHYRELASDFAIYPYKVELHYLTTGLLLEVLEAGGATAPNLLSELGDVAWFCDRILSAFSELLPEPGEIKTGRQSIRKRAQRIADIGAKAARDSGTTVLTDLPDEQVEELYTCVQAVYALTVRRARRLGYTEKQLLEANIKKLNDRMKRGVIGGSGDNR